MRAALPRLRDLLTPAALALLASCGGSPPPPAGEAPSVERLVRDGLAPIGRTREEIAEALGPPDSTRTRVVPNRHVPGVRDTLFELFYPGLRVGIHHPGGGGDLLSSVAVASDRYLRYSRSGIGATREEVRELLGPPWKEAADALTYLCAGCPGAEQPVTFLFEDGRVVLVRFDHYVD